MKVLPMFFCLVARQQFYYSLLRKKGKTTQNEHKDWFKVCIKEFEKELDLMLLFLYDCFQHLL